MLIPKFRLRKSTMTGKEAHTKVIMRKGCLPYASDHLPTMGACKVHTVIKKSCCTGCPTLKGAIEKINVFPRHRVKS
jgi:hypothetical protein